MSLKTLPAKTIPPRGESSAVAARRSEGKSKFRAFRDRYADRTFTIVATTILLLSIIAVIYPLYFIVIASISDPNAVYEGRVWLFPSGVTFEGYQRILTDGRIWSGLANTMIYTVLGTAISVSTILCGAYALSRKDLPGRKYLMLLFVITMFFDGGLITKYLVVKDLGLLNTVWAVVLPGAIGVWNLIIARSFFENTIPNELREAAQMDGANDFRFFFQMVLPLSKPLIMLMIMVHVVANWNSFFDALIFLNDDSKYPLQLVLRNILIQSDVSSTGTTGGDIASYAAAQRIAELTKYAMIVVSSLPLMIALPFMQKHFTKGMMIGAVK
ncbi:carbohydrate ABC transporter permease [Glutamicibacter halophytocola]|uniref:carbohydrate ABC transporter permease n=1 Tax=Glutamicibacter halophytocola TaxID=1933880 RepID=UPI00155834AF|nr:carbohydrate ABC transporter permease [Glutamicibacter halophytocola]NQD42450.1 carbohydrate ABC transporter permease [Glutamicibacter halophytocola]